MGICDAAYVLMPSIWCKEVLGFKPDPWQEQVLDSNSKRILLLCSRQSGKSTVSSVVALHTMIFKPGSLVLMISPTQSQSDELFKKLMYYFDLIDPKPETKVITKTTLELENGSRCISRPGSEVSTRGFSAVSLLVIDEAARTRDELFYSLTPMLAISKGKLLAISTPYGKRGWFYNEWIDDNLWEKYKVTALNCPRITAEFLANEKRTHPAGYFDQEYMCEFSDTVESVFSWDDIEKMQDNEVEPMDFGDPGWGNV